MALGHWAKDYLGPKEAGGGSGGGAFIVTFTADRQGMEIKGIKSVDKTFQEVIDALTAGKTVIAKLTNLAGYDKYISCSKYGPNEVIFSSVVARETSGGSEITTVNVETITLNSAGSQYYEYTAS